MPKYLNRKMILIRMVEIIIVAMNRGPRSTAKSLTG